MQSPAAYSSEEEEPELASPRKEQSEKEKAQVWCIDSQ